MTDKVTGDALERQKALEPGSSFLVQAPAGSGKTELLVQRFLRLLSVVEAPEEVVALTFTRKAAAEMRQRISAALLDASNDVAVHSEHGRQTRALAAAALQRDQQQGWGLCRNASRLRVQTLDSLCAAITRQMPMLSAFGAQPEIAEDAQQLYLQAARYTLDELERGHHWSRAIARLLIHLNNDLERLAELLAQMLARRDQWLRLVGNRHDPRRRRENLEAALSALTETALEHALDIFPGDEIAQLAECARFAARYLPEALAEQSPIAHLRGLRSLPEADSDCLAQWQGLSELLLTREGKWRKGANVNLGFPPASAAASAEEKALFSKMKAQHAALIERCAEHAALGAALAIIPALPAGRYTDDQWAVLAALLELLQLAAASLQLVFSEYGAVDFIEMAERASLALGGDETPTDLALAMDYRISHLLVDEFQDTSLTQFRLLGQLVAGWQPGDGRSLFLVGDPMQSIYRFRQAEVGLYLQVRDYGLGPISLTFCRLSANFRSQPAVIDWVNRIFPTVMPPPEAEDPAAGAISYTAANAQRDAGEGGVHLHAFLDNDWDEEARRVAELVSAARHEQSDASVAILVRGRRHMAHLMPHLKTRGLLFQAVDIDALGQRPVIQDLLALTRCLLHPGDRLSWLAVLRAPWCGLRLADLQVIAGEQFNTAVWQRLQAPGVMQSLSADARGRVQRLSTVLAASLAERGRLSLRRWVEGTWLALGGPAAASDKSELEAAEVYFDLLDELDEGSDLADFGRLSQQVDALYAPPDPNADPRLQIMTIHRAKGLEFNVVIVPGLGRAPANPSQPLLFWMELPREPLSRPGQGDADLLLAPIAAAGESGEPIYQYLKTLDKGKLQFEDARLMYVAATRARNHLHLLGHVPMRDDGPGKPAAGSLLERLWPGIAAEFIETAVAPQSVAATPSAISPPMLRRLQSDWRLPAPPSGLDGSGQETGDDPVPDLPQVEYFWAGADVRHVGTVVHEVLMHIGRDGVAEWDAARVEGLKPAISSRLKALGIAPIRVGKRATTVITALTNTLVDPRGRWILHTHAEALSEHALSGVHEGARVNVVIDRSFVDEQGQRWIIDYKTGSHEGANTESFLDQEQARHAPQLQRYASLLAHTDSRPIRLGLYFPMLGGWREWAAG